MKRTALVAAVSLLGLTLAAPAGAGNLRVLRVGLGTGTVSASSPGISCGTDCSEPYAATVTSLTLTAMASSDSTFVGWQGDCTGTTCVLNMSADHSVKAVFATSAIAPLAMADLTPAGLTAYLAPGAHDNVNSPARFIAALPAEFRKNWIMMSRSESLQTGTAKTPRFLLPNANAQNVFTFGMARHSSYPGADPLAIEFMQWNPTDKNFHFHEVVLGHIDALGAFASRERGVSADDPRCTKCHSTRNVPNPGPYPGTTGNPIGSVKWKNKPNWDPYASWAGMLPFNRDRIYRGRLEDTAFRQIFNLWKWRNDDGTRAFIEQLDLQPNGAASIHPITRVATGPNEGSIVLSYDSITPPSATTAKSGVTYGFNGAAGPAPGSTVQQGGDFLTLHHSADPANDEGRGVRFFDTLGGLAGTLNQTRIADEVAGHRFATGSVPFDVRPLAVAITKGCLARNAAGNTVTGAPAAMLTFMTARNGGMTINDVYNDTRARTQSIPLRKADIQKKNLDRTGDVYIRDAADERGLIQEYGATPLDLSVERLRSEIFRRPKEGFRIDSTVMGGIYIDREDYVPPNYPNTEFMALYRYFLEPLGVSVDKWSMGVRGRSRAYGFADVFSTYTSQLQSGLEASITAEPIASLADTSCPTLTSFIAAQAASLPAAADVPKYTDVQRIFNKGCIECHGGLAYPPFDKFFPATYLDLSEDETNSAGDRLTRPFNYTIDFTSMDVDPTMSYLYQRITRPSEACPNGMMPCGGPALSKVDIETIGRWITGARLYSHGDPHLQTVDGTHYDFQSAGEFTLLRGEGLEIQTRQTPVQTEHPLGPNEHTGLSSCVSLNTATAMRVGPHRISYQPDGGAGRDKLARMVLRVDGNAVELGVGGFVLASGGRILPTADGGIQVEYRGGTDVVVTPAFWDPYKVWYLMIDVRRARATEGLMGTIAPGNWLPSLPDGTFLGPLPASLHQRQLDLYGRFADAWRVTTANSLFDYAPGKSTNNFTLRSWPAESPQNCTLPLEDADFPAGPVVAKGMTVAEAQGFCGAVVAADRRANCEADVAVTGDAGFAKAYLAAERIQLNQPPRPPVLTYPEDDKTELPGTVDFRWVRTVDTDGGKLDYHLCVWAAGDPHVFGKCQELPKRSPVLEGNNFWILLIALILLLVFVLIAAVRNRSGKLLLLALLILLFIVAVLYLGLQKNMSKSIQLDPGKAYFWKVVVQDGQGGTSESEMRRFATK